MENSDNNIASAKDVLQLILLEMYKGKEVTITTSGTDEKEAFSEIKALIEKNYDFD